MNKTIFIFVVSVTVSSSLVSLSGNNLSKAAAINQVYSFKDSHVRQIDSNIKVVVSNPLNQEGAIIIQEIADILPINAIRPVAIGIVFGYGGSDCNNHTVEKDLGA